jgi:hypothetical protein
MLSRSFVAATNFAVAAMMATSCGSPSVIGDSNGFWLSKDGGTGIIVFAEGGQTLWLPQKMVISKINVVIDVPCSDFFTDSNGRVSAVGGSSTKSALSPANDGGYTMTFDFTGLDVDGAYRRNTANDRSNIVGKVTAAFFGRFLLATTDSALVDYSLEYSDTVKPLSSEGALLTLARSKVCK